MKAELPTMYPIPENPNGIPLVRALAKAAEFQDVLWHFTSEQGYAEIQSGGFILPSVENGRWGKTAATELGAVALFDFASLNDRQIEECEYQCGSFISRENTQRMIGLRSCGELVRYPETRICTTGQGPIPHAEVCYLGKIPLSAFCGVYHFDWAAQILVRIA